MGSSATGILVVDDEQKICRICEKILSKEGYNAVCALDGYEAIRRLKQGVFAVVVTDLKMSRMGGMEVLRRVKEEYPDTQVVVITGYATVSNAVEVMKMGAFDYLPKPFTPDELRSVVRRAVAKREACIRDRERLDSPASPEPVAHQLIGESEQLKTVVKMIQKVAPTDSTVLICGESGTGKELIARAIHANSNRRDQVFFAVDCGTLSGNLLESELFGYRKGAFTGAEKDKEGIFTAARGGTVFLDEISNVSLEVQGKLLRFVESREFLPLGSATREKADVRLVFATNRDLQEMVKEGVFRQDFYYRIYVYPIVVPPLRERRVDIVPIAHHFLSRFAEAIGKKIKGFEERAAERLVLYDWPGNVRQLRNIIERAVILCEGDTISLRDLPMADADEGFLETIPSNNEELKRAKQEVRKRVVDKLERSFLLQALAQAEWNVTRAAENTGIQRTHLQAMMKKHGVKRPQSP